VADTLKTLSLDDQFEQMQNVGFEDVFPQGSPVEQKVPDFQLPTSLPEGLFDSNSNPSAFQTAQRFASQFGGGENDPILKALQELPDKIVQALRNG
jgi:hypothetical protein